MRKVKIEIYDILDLILDALDLGFYNDITLSSFAEFLDNKLSDEEIQDYISHKLRFDDGISYDEEDIEHWKEELVDFRTNFIDQ